tara:strand:- start:4272 stop:4553 length:282 start_codon:yes stop_codon:yes gene_type:complete
VSGAERSVAAAPTIATRAELTQRIEARPEPAPQQHLTPSGWETAESQRQVNTANENRIAALRTSLGTAHETLNTDMRLANLRGHAKADFGHSR